MTNFEQQATQKVLARENATRQQQIDAERTALEQDADARRTQIIAAFNRRRREAFAILQTTRRGYERRQAITDEIAKLTAEIESIDRGQQPALHEANRLIQTAGYEVLEANGGVDHIIAELKKNAGIPVDHAYPLTKPISNVQILATGYVNLVVSKKMLSVESDSSQIALLVGPGYTIACS